MQSVDIAAKKCQSMWIILNFNIMYKEKQIEFLMHDPGVKRLMEKVHDIFIDKYKPISYIFFFYFLAYC